MAYPASYIFTVTNGATLKWSAVRKNVLHATLRNQTTGIYQIGTSDLWEFDFAEASIPDGHRGVIVLHTNTASAASDFTSANALSGLSVNPGELELIEKVPLASGTIASTTGTATTLDAGAVANADYYVGAKLVTTSGTGAGQERIITAYTVGRVATHAAWDVNPDSSSGFQIQTGLTKTTNPALQITVQQAGGITVTQS